LIHFTDVSRIIHDLRYAYRSLVTTPGFTVVALLVLTLSIGVLTAIFSLVDAVVLRPLPFEDSDRLVAVGERVITENSPGSRNRAAPQNFLDWRDRQNVFTGLAGTWETSIVLRREGAGEPEVLRAWWVTADFFPVLKVMPAIGRPFTIENEGNGRARVAVISHALWQRRFGGAADITSQRLPGILGDFEIMGVMPAGFSFPVGERVPTDVWLPFPFSDEDRVRGNSFGYNMEVIGRLRDGVSIEQARQRMDAITAELARETPRWFEDRVAHVEPLHEFVTRPVRRWMLMLLWAVAFVMLIACVNLANLMLVRATTRSRELGVRSALGASRWDLCRLLLAESLMLSVAGALCGVLLARVGIDVLRALIPAEVPRAAGVAVDLRVMAAMVAAAIATGVVFGLTPLLQFRRRDSSAVLQRERVATADTSVQWLRSAFVVSEVALAVMLVIGAGLFLGSFARVASVDLGIDRQNVLMVRVRPFVGPPQASTAAPVTSPEIARARHPAMLERVLERVRAAPGIEAASLAGGGLPLRGDLTTANFGVPGRALPRNTDIALNEISPDFFKVLNVRLLRGRLFTDADRSENEAVAILNEAAARRYFANGDALGKVVQLRGTRTVVGIVNDIRHDGPESEWRTQAYIPFAQARLVGATLVVKTAGEPLAMLPAVKQAIWSEFPQVPVSDADTLEQYFRRLVAAREFNMLVVGLFGVLGLGIAAVGIYGVMAYVVARRTNEIGIRLALGAAPASIMRSVLRESALWLAAGLAIGVGAAYLRARLVRTLLFQVQPEEPVVYVLAIAILALIGMAAAFVPARRAARVDPLVALRAE
jgi:putative ABC transport system permease protein